ncbi:MAG: hypothetical protein ACRC6R_10250 [Bacteroidales bacterium]
MKQIWYYRQVDELNIACESLEFEKELNKLRKEIAQIKKIKNEREKEAYTLALFTRMLEADYIPQQAAMWISSEGIEGRIVTKAAHHYVALFIDDKE